jgi:hypothetical protein
MYRYVKGIRYLNVEEQSALLEIISARLKTNPLAKRKKSSIMQFKARDSKADIDRAASQLKVDMMGDPRLDDEQ